MHPCWEEFCDGLITFSNCKQDWWQSAHQELAQHWNIPHLVLFYRALKSNVSLLKASAIDESFQFAENLGPSTTA